MLNSQNKEITKNPYSCAEWGNREVPKAAFHRLRAVCESAGSFFTPRRKERCLIMSTYLNSTPICDYRHFDQLERRAANWEALEPVEPPPIGTPNPDQVLRVDAPRHVWPVYLVHVPKDWKPTSWRSAPPNTTTYKKAKTAAKVAALLNRERMHCSEAGYVSHWFIRIKLGSKYANISVTLPKPWKPKDEYDLPPAFIRIDGPREQCKQIVGELNNRFDQCEPGEPRKRAYIARSIHPDDLEPLPAKDEPDTPQLYRLNTGYQFDVNPPCGEEVVIYVYNESDENKAKAKAEAYLKRHAQDLLEWGHLDLEAVEEEMLKQYGLELLKRDDETNNRSK